MAIMVRSITTLSIVLFAASALSPSLAVAWDTRAYSKLLRTHKCRNCDLREISLRGASLVRVDLRRARLQDADLSATNMKRARLQGADLRGADLTDANLLGAKMKGAKLEGAKFCLTIMPDGATNNKDCKK